MTEANGHRSTTIDRINRHQTVAVVGGDGSRRLVQRLAALGVVPGAELTVVRPRGPALVVLGGARIAIGRTAIPAVRVREVAE